MRTRHQLLVLLVVALLGGMAAASAVGGAVGHSVRSTADRSTANATLVVDDDGSADYQSIQAAVDAAAAGDTVEVRPGTYAEQLTLNENVTLRAPAGATLDGAELDGSPVAFTIPAGSDAAPVIAGFRVTGYADGVNATDARGAWTVRNVTFVRNQNDAIAAVRSSGAWSVRDTVMRRNGDEGIDTENSTGDWVAANATFVRNGGDSIDADGRLANSSWTLRDSEILRSGDEGIDADGGSGIWLIANTTFAGNAVDVQFNGAATDLTIRNSVFRNTSHISVSAGRSTGNWAIRNSSFRRVKLAAVSAPETTGDWVIRDVRVRNVSVGVSAAEATGDWTVTNASFRGLTPPRFDLIGEGTAVLALQTTGDWTVRYSTFEDADGPGVNATGASPRGDATRNWWGDAGGPDQDDCVGNVTCGNALSEPPVISEPPALASEFDGRSTGGSEFLTLPVRASIAALAIVLPPLFVYVRRRGAG